MIVTVILGFFCVIFAYLTKYKHGGWGLKASFTLIFLFLALRYNFGNDYETYLNSFIEINRYNQVEYYDNSTHGFEIGWLYLNWLFRPFGFFAMTAALALLNCVAYYHFIKKYVPVTYYWLAIFIYIFYPEFMLIHASAMRQSIAIIFFLFSLDYLCKKNAIRYFLCVGVASLFHVSALILLPLYLLGLLSRRIYTVMGIIFLSIYVLIIYSAQFLSPFVVLFINSFLSKYAGYNEAGIVDSGFGLLYFGVMITLTLYFVRRQNNETALVFMISIIGSMLIPLNLIIGLIARTGMYFAPATIIAYSVIPVKIRNVSIKNIIGKTIYITLIIAATTYRFVQFFNSDTYKDYYTFYQTIFSAQQWY